MNAAELDRKVTNLEALASDADRMSETQRGALRDEVRELHGSLEPASMMKTHAAGGAVAGVVLPVLGLFSGGLVGAAVGAVRANADHVVRARRRLERLLDTLARG